jgi:hypothetical protein
MPHSITDGDACRAYFNKIWGIPVYAGSDGKLGERHRLIIDR